MKCLGLTVLVGLLSFVALGAKDLKQPLRVELAERQRLSGYSLVDWGSAGEVYVVSVKDRTWTRTKAKDIEKLTSTECAMPGEHYSLFRKDGIWLRDNESGATQQIDAQGQYYGQCYSPEHKIVYTAGTMVRAYDLAVKKSTDIAEGSYPTWSPDGKWLGFEDGKHYVLLNLKTGARKKLFSTKNATGAKWSPDSQYLTYTKSGGSTGGFPFWGIKCIEPYRVWVWRVQDDAHDWVKEICKPGRSFIWVKNSDLLSQ